jgi:hypothetical protein
LSVDSGFQPLVGEGTWHIKYFLSFSRFTL